MSWALGYDSHDTASGFLLTCDSLLKSKETLPVLIIILIIIFLELSCFPVFGFLKIRSKLTFMLLLKQR